MVVRKRIFVLDTSAFIAGFDPNSVGSEQYTVPMVKKELFPNSLPWLRFNTAVENSKLKVTTPSIDFLNKAKKASEGVGNAHFLSEVDLQVLALALELKEVGHTPLIVTDDYSIQNVANQMGVEFTSLITFGIRFEYKWILYCPACYRKYSSENRFNLCIVCGTKLKRKPIKKTTVKKKPRIPQYKQNNKKS